MSKNCELGRVSRDQLTDMENCPFDSPDYEGWHKWMECWTSEQVTSFLRHQVHCVYEMQEYPNAHASGHYYSCMYDKDVDLVAEYYPRYYPDEIRQPILFVNGCGSIEVRLTNPFPEIYEYNQFDGKWNLDNLECSFHIIQKIDRDENGNRLWKVGLESMTFDLSCENGWNKMLGYFPQEIRDAV